MRILLDECLPARLARSLAGHEVRTAPQMGWAGLTNGELLTNAEGKFDVFITIDRSMTFQQNISRFTLFLIVLHAKSNRLADVEPLAQQIIDAINKAQPGTVAHVG